MNIANMFPLRRCRTRVILLPRVIWNKKLLLVLGTFVTTLFIYFTIYSKKSLSQHIHSIINLNRGSDTIRLPQVPSTRLTWHGGGNNIISNGEAEVEEDLSSLEENDESSLPPNLSIKKPFKEKPPQVLVILRKDSSNLYRAITEILEYSKFRYSREVIAPGESSPSILSGSASQVRCIIFEDFRHYLSLEAVTRAAVDSFMRDNGIGMIAFLPLSSAPKVSRQEQLQSYPVIVHSKLNVKDVRLVPNTTGVYRILRPEGGWTVQSVGRPFSGMVPQHSTIEVLQEAILEGSTSWWDKPTPTAIVDRGKLDGIKRVVFGGGLSLWLNKLLLLDALTHCSGGSLTLPLQRYTLVDVDDIFVAKTGTRMKKDDVQEMIAAQERLRSKVPGFTFNLGFSGYYFLSGNAEENDGDKELVSNADKFWWFGHMWRHTQPHKMATVQDLKQKMLLNKHFAKTYNISTNSGYSVAPHHSGVYPIHEPLYYAWKKVWGVKATSTEEYPHLRPDRKRKGFIHRGIMVLPRQTCGLFTHTLLFESDEHPGLKAKLDASISGGELFQTIVFNPITVFMTHMTNYGSDRLGLYVFEGVVEQLEKFTNLKVLTEPPVELAKRYFTMYPEEQEPLWGNPCLDKRHLEIWSSNKSCSQLPDFLVLGPQKTGTTALYTFLGVHPKIKHNIPSPDTFEEVQFFSSNNYHRGLDWYLKAFSTTRDIDHLMFEKSATYFDSEVAPRRVKAMLPHAKLVVLLLPPEKRAYSWYQHQRGHNIQAAVDHSFSVVLRAAQDPATADKALLDLRARCLGPGEYARHLDNWLSKFASDQLHIIDGEQLKSDPVAVMKELQQFLGVTPVMDYSQLIRFNSKKGFYCTISGTSTKCLGRSKGKKYAPMLPEDEAYLKEYYAPHNSRLADLLQKMGAPLPLWLRGQLAGLEEQPGRVKDLEEEIEEEP